MNKTLKDILLTINGLIAFCSVGQAGAIGSTSIVILILYLFMKNQDLKNELQTLKDRYEPTINHNAVRDYLNSEQFKTTSQFINDTVKKEN